MDKEVLKLELNSTQIKTITDYDLPLSFLDKVTYLDNNQLQAIANTTMGESFFQGHFPGNPVMPGVLTIQAMVQAAEVFCKENKKGTPNLTKLQKARFKKMILPGNQLKIILKQTKFEKDKIEFSGETLVNNEVACSANLSFLLND